MNNPLIWTDPMGLENNNVNKGIKLPKLIQDLLLFPLHFLLPRSTDRYSVGKVELTPQTKELIESGRITKKQTQELAELKKRAYKAAYYLPYKAQWTIVKTGLTGQMAMLFPLAHGADIATVAYTSGGISITTSTGINIISDIAKGEKKESGRISLNQLAATIDRAAIVMILTPCIVAANESLIGFASEKATTFATHTRYALTSNYGMGPATLSPYLIVNETTQNVLTALFYGTSIYVIGSSFDTIKETTLQIDSEEGIKPLETMKQQFIDLAPYKIVEHGIGGTMLGLDIDTTDYYNIFGSEGGERIYYFIIDEMQAGVND
ncbi:MAG: hypothetical protein JXB88_25555 [Spirochaetales bacterium]|nr:hypothetical protein [Spirochaetales bacterium]